MNIDPLSPYLPLALLVATVVALLRGMLSDAKGVSKLDGKAVVLPIVLAVSFGVVVWSQLHTGLVWSKVAVDTPIVFVLAAGGATFLQRLKDRGLLSLTGEVSDLKLSPPVDPATAAQLQEELATQKTALENVSSKLLNGTLTIVGKVETDKKPPPADAASVP